MADVVAPLPGLITLLSFDEPWLPPENWVDLSQYVAGKKNDVLVSTKMGKQHELDTITPSNLKLQLFNEDGRFWPWNTSSPYASMGVGLYPQQPIKLIGCWPGPNFITAVDSTPSSGLGTFTAVTNCTVGRSSGYGLAYSGGYAFTMTSGTSGAMIAELGPYDVISGTIYSAMASFMASVTGEPCFVGLAFYDATNTIIGSPTYSTGYNDGTPANGYFQNLVSVTAPTGAVTCKILLQITAAASSEEHFVDCAALMLKALPQNLAISYNVPSNWELGAGPTTYSPVYYGYVKSWVPAFANLLQPYLKIEAEDALAAFAAADMTSFQYEATMLTVPDLQAWYKFGDLPGTTQPVDSSGNNNTATSSISGIAFGSATPLACDVNTAAELTQDSADNVIGTIRVPNVVLTATSGQYIAVGGWLSTQSTGLAFGLILVAGSYLQLGINASGQAAVASGLGELSGGSVADGLGHFVVFVMQVANPGTGYLYVDGVEVASGSMWASTTLTPTEILISAQADPLFSVIGDITVGQWLFTVGASALSSSLIAALYQLGAEGFSTQQSGQRIAQALANVGFPSALTSLATGLSDVQGATATLVGTKLLQYLQSVETTEDGLFFQGPDGVVRFYDRHYPLLSPNATTSQGTFSDSGLTYPFELDDFSPGFDNLDWWNEVSGGAQTGPGTPPNPTGALQVVDVAASQSLSGGKRTLALSSSLLVTSDALALARVQHSAARYGSPQQRVRAIKIKSTTAQGTNNPQALGRGLWDRVTTYFTGQNTNGGPLDQDSLIEGIEHSITPNEWTTTFRLSPAELQPYLILDSAVHGNYDSGDQWGY